MAGRIFEIISNSLDSLDIFIGLEDVSLGLTNGVSIEVIPYWTLDSLFPQGNGVHPSSNFNAQTHVMTFSGDEAGVNLTNDNSFFYYDGSLGGLFSAPGWYRVGSSLFQNFGKHPIDPHAQIIVRHNVAGDTEFRCMGYVFSSPQRSIINVLGTGVPQDNTISLTNPLDVTLDDSQLFQSGVFEGADTFNPTSGDQLLVFDSNIREKNKSNSLTYFYYTGNLFGGAGWRLVGSDPSIIVGDAIAFSLSKQCIIRKKAGPVGSQIWLMTPNYLPFN